MPGVKSNKIRLENNIAQVAKMLMRGRTRSYILEHAEKHWGIKRAQTDNLMAAARERLLEANRSSIEQNQAVICSSLWEQYRIAHKAKAAAVCIKALTELAKIYGLDQGVLTLKVDRPLKDLTDEELAAALREEGDG